ncbi:MAG: hypothetical protein ACR2M1_04675 [Gemmatimonadaceae bacterium]
MPPTFLYLLAAFVYSAVAVVVLVASFFLWCVPRTRALGVRMAAAMLGSIPGVLAFQLLAGPVALGLVLVLSLVAPASPITNSIPWIVVSVATLILAFGSMLVGSITGFIVGWRAGWQLASGAPPNVVLGSVPVYGRLFRSARGVGTAA